eukprot:gene11572-13672_t
MKLIADIHVKTWREALLIYEGNSLEYSTKITSNLGDALYVVPSISTWSSLEGTTAVEKKRKIFNAAT